MSNASGRYAFEGFRVDAHARQLLDAAGQPLPLTAKAFDVLMHLIEHRDRVVGKDELMAHVWSGRVVEENNLNQAVSALRRAFGTGAGDHRYIVTVPGHGYRFVAQVDGGVDDVPPSQTPALTAADARTASHRRGWIVAAVAAAALLLPAFLFWPRPAHSPPTAANTATLAVLPFRALPSAASDELLELGMAETLIARLSQAGALQVRSLDASRRLRSQDPMDAGRQLRVAYVVTGSTQRQGGRMRVTVRLLHVPDGRTLWAGTFDEQRDRVFALQDAIAEAVAGALTVKVVRTAQRHSPCDGDNVEAYRAYLSGRYVLSRPTVERLSEAEAALGRAIELDPTCARAHAVRAQLRLQQLSLTEHDPGEQYRLAWADVNRALELDPRLADAYVARGLIQVGYYWDATQAEASLARALELDAGSASVHAAYADVLATAGRDERAALHLWRAQVLGPLSPWGTLIAAAWLYRIDPVAAQALLARTLEAEPGYWFALWQRAAWARNQGHLAEAIADLEQAARNSGRNSRVLSSLARTYMAARQPERARALLQEMEQRQRQGYVHPSALAITYYELGDDAHALDQLERAYTQRDLRIANLGDDPYWQRLHANPRFQALARRAVLKSDRPAARN